MRENTHVDGDELLTVAELARRWKLRPQTIYSWLWEGRLPSYKLGRARRIRRRDADAFLESHYKSARATV